MQERKSFRIFLSYKKRDRTDRDIEPDWVHLDTDENGIKMNFYFVQHPEIDTWRNENGIGAFSVWKQLVAV